MFAIIETGGKQYKVSPGGVFKTEKLSVSGDHKKGDVVTFEKVLLIDDGGKVTVGTPYIAGAKIQGVIEEVGKSKKITVQKFKAKVRYRKKYGHRQPYTKIKITG